MYTPQIIRYMKTIYEKSADRIRSFMDFSGLELAIAGVPNEFFDTTTVPPIDARDFYILNSNVGEFRSDSRNVYVIRASDGKTVSLHPASVRKDCEGYVKQVLNNNGMHPSSADAKKIARLLDDLRKRLGIAK